MLSSPGAGDRAVPFPSLRARPSHSMTVTGTHYGGHNMTEWQAAWTGRTTQTLLQVPELALDLDELFDKGLFSEVRSVGTE